MRMIVLVALLASSCTKPKPVAVEAPANFDAILSEARANGGVDVCFDAPEPEPVRGRYCVRHLAPLPAPSP